MAEVVPLKGSDKMPGLHKPEIRPRPARVGIRLRCGDCEKIGTWDAMARGEFPYLLECPFCGSVKASFKVL